MKKIPTLFQRTFQNGRVVDISPEVTPGFEWVLKGEGIATMKIDGSCCAIIGGEFYKRFDAKPGRKIPTGAIPCCEPDPVTGHWPHWVKVRRDDPADKWFIAAYRNVVVEDERLPDWTYEAIGPHFRGNPYQILEDTLTPHGIVPVCVERSYDGIREYLQANPVEGLVFWLGGEPQCKIKRSDFGLPWPDERQ